MAKKKIKSNSPALAEALAEIDKKHGTGSIMRLGQTPSAVADALSTGVLSLDVALGIGGIPRGQPIEIFGPEATGKTTLALHIVAEAQKLDETCAYIDAEHSLDPVYAAVIGVDVDNLLLSQPDSAEEALDIIDTLASSGAVSVIVLDSVAAMVPRAEIEGDFGDSHMGLQARLMSQALRKLKSTLHNSGTICIFINQLRMKIGVVYGSPETTPGGRALPYAASVRIDIRKSETIKNGPDEILGNRAKATTVKNKTAPPYKVAYFDIMYGKGISREGALLDVGVDLGVIEKSGSWYAYNGKLGQGRENAKQYLIDNPIVFDEIDRIVRAQLNPTP